MLLKELLKEKNLQQKDLMKVLNADKQFISRLANYKYLPTPEQAKKICDFLECNIFDIYNKSEIDLILGTRRASRNKDSHLYYRLSVRLNKSGCNSLKLQNLKLLGYKTIKEWVIECISNLEKRQKEARKEQRRLNDDKRI